VDRGDGNINVISHFSTEMSGLARDVFTFDALGKGENLFDEIGTYIGTGFEQACEIRRYVGDS